MSYWQRLTERYSSRNDPLRSERRAELIVLVLIGLLGLQLIWGVLQLALLSPPDPVNPSADSVQVGAGVFPDMVSAEQAQGLLQRPLFWPDRRPAGDVAPPQELAEEAATQAGIEGLQLVGVFGEGRSAGIIVLHNTTKLRVGVGQTIAGWRVQSIEPGAAVLASSKGTRRLLLRPEADAAQNSRGLRQQRVR